MKFVLMTIGIFSIFHAVSSRECYRCNVPLDKNDPGCTHPEQFSCGIGMGCAKTTSYENGVKYVGKYCVVKERCFSEFTLKIKGVDVTTSCCETDLCNGSESVFQNKVVHYTLILTAMLKLFF